MSQPKLKLPLPPQTIEETGINFLFLVELLSKILFLNGQMRLLDIAFHSKLTLAVLEPLLAFMRTERMCEVSRQSEAETAITYVLTELGRLRAQDFLKKSQYAGAAPVNLADYTARIRRQSVIDTRITKQRVTETFQGIVLRHGTLDLLGPAMNSGRAIFVYGPAGSGKTFIAEKLGHLFPDNIAIPYALLVDNEVIQIFDPLLHKPAQQVESGTSLDRGNTHDQRWVPCQRPAIITGGELTLNMLDLDFDESARFYQAPPQVKANNGLLIIDDLGRQLVSPQNLMNRWIVPLDRRIDYLALHTGTKFMIPFDVTVIFSSNIPPATLADEAFLRRLGYKIYIGAMSEEEYRSIFKQVCSEYAIDYQEGSFNYLLQHLHYKYQKPLLACIPRDLLGQVRDYARYHEVKPRLTEELLDIAWNNYYARDEL
ncbi:MAG: ATP-binding protein [Rhodocyclaceae bacterium]|nr:ATP-binding protein [Rhodocyclaceae bacterium]